MRGGWRNALLGGWEMNTVTLLETGPWLTPSISNSYDQSNTNVVNRGAYLRPDQVSTNFYRASPALNISISRRSRRLRLARALWQCRSRHPAGPGHEDSQPGPGQSVQVKERMRVRFESTFTNVLNHTNFAPPATQIDNTTTFGVLSAPQTAENAGNRTGQPALRIEF